MVLGLAEFLAFNGVLVALSKFIYDYSYYDYYG